MNLLDKWQLKCLSAMANTKYPEGLVDTVQEKIWERNSEMKVKVYGHGFYDLIEKTQNNEN